MLANIEAERGRNGYSKESISRELGITSKTYRSYVTSADMPTSILLRLCDMFGCSADYLLGRSQEGVRPSDAAGYGTGTV